MGLHSHVCDAGGQFVCESRSGGFTRTNGVPARLRLCYSALFLDATGHQWLWRGGPCHPWEVKPHGSRGWMKKCRCLFFSFSPHSEGPSRDVILHLTTGRIHNKNVSTHLIGSISKGENNAEFTTSLKDNVQDGLKRHWNVFLSNLNELHTWVLHLHQSWCQLTLNIPAFSVLIVSFFLNKIKFVMSEQVQRRNQQRVACLLSVH